MRTNPISMGIFYLVMGLLFIYLAISTANASKGIFSFPTILLMLMATFDIGVAIRIFLFTRKVKKNNKQK
ncbi:YdiK family protein [Metabacillus niabensis]|uniref:DUF4305 domain-containing protein n=1 Tax=Metabacillus niabensis TaxID=324854 RepID=A0ABT9Z7T4_9BACI|nr:YdiK family protein [Metabacillus niabensis]MDQ0228331.1 hypothetical protein [Metabacillus niabensis]PAD67170.1 hypothetical protein CHH83_20300 [Bacillus sp. 7586-K]